MTRKHQILSPRLILTGLTRLRTPLLCLGILSLTLEALPFLLGALTGRDWMDFAHIAPAAYLLPFAGPILFLCAFSFLFRRADADFTMSLPFSRVCLFFSYAASVMAGVVLLAAGIGVCSLAFGLLHFDFFSPTLLLSVLGAGILSAFILTGFMALAVTLTGRLAVSLITFPVLTILVRMTLQLLYESSLAAFTPVDVVFENIASWTFFFPFAFLSTNSFLQMFIAPVYDTSYFYNPAYAYGSGTSCITWTPGSLVWSILAGLLLWAAALLLFRRRRSEWTGSPAAGRGASMILGGVFTLLAAVPAAVMAAGRVMTTDVMLWLIIAAALLVWPLWVLITARSFRALVRILPAYLAVLAVSVGLGITGASLGAYGPTVTPENARAVYIPSLSTIAAGNESPLDTRFIRSQAVTDPAMVADAAARTAWSTDSTSYNAYFILKDGRILRASVWVESKGNRIRARDDFVAAYREAYDARPDAAPPSMDGLVTVWRIAYPEDERDYYSSLPTLIPGSPARRALGDCLSRELDPAHPTDQQKLVMRTRSYGNKAPEPYEVFILIFTDPRTGSAWYGLVTEDECPESFACIKGLMK